MANGNGNELAKRSHTDMVLAEYDDFNLENMQKEAAALPSGGSAFFKPHQGKNVVRMLPPPKGKKQWLSYHKHHFSIGNERKNVICAKAQYGQPCPLCSKAAKLRSTGNKLDLRKARALEPTSQVYMNVVDMKNPEKGVQLWTMTPSVFKGVMDAIELAGVSNPAHPLKGFNIIFKRKGEGLNTRYSGYTLAREATELPGWEELLPAQKDLLTVEEAPSDEQMEEALNGTFEERDFKSRKASVKKKDDDAEDAEFEEDGDDGDDDDDIEY